MMNFFFPSGDGCKHTMKGMFFKVFFINFCKIMLLLQIFQVIIVILVYRTRNYMQSEFIGEGVHR